MKVIEIEFLARAFGKHAVTCGSANISANILCSVHVAFESWFRLELAQTLHAGTEGIVSFGRVAQGIAFCTFIDYTYGRMKDLCARFSRSLGLAPISYRS